MKYAEAQEVAITLAPNIDIGVFPYSERAGFRRLLNEVEHAVNRLFANDFTIITSEMPAIGTESYHVAFEADNAITGYRTSNMFGAALVAEWAKQQHGMKQVTVALEHWNSRSQWDIDEVLDSWMTGKRFLSKQRCDDYVRMSLMEMLNYNIPPNDIVNNLEWAKMKYRADYNIEGLLCTCPICGGIGEEVFDGNVHCHTCAKRA